MYAACAVMTQHCWVEGILDESQQSWWRVPPIETISMTKASLEIGGHVEVTGQVFNSAATLTTPGHRIDDD